jgi:hypothetical protein
MGNGCGLNAAVAKHFSDKGHEVYELEQINGNMAAVDAYAELISSVNPDLLYYEMLDEASFKSIEQIKCKKILVYASKGILDDFDDIVNHKEWFDGIYTNSKHITSLCAKHDIPCDLFKYYHCWIAEDDIDVVDEYRHDCTFLGMGFNRLQSDAYKLERELFFLRQWPFDFKIYGNGWPQEIPWCAGVLPQADMGRLYGSTKSAFAIIAPNQRDHGMINNRFVELGYCRTPIITYPYESVDWYGADKFLNFVESPEEIIKTVGRCVEVDSEILEKAEGMKKFVVNQTECYYDALNSLIERL